MHDIWLASLLTILVYSPPLFPALVSPLTAKEQLLTLMEVPSMPDLSPTGEIASFLDVNQFQPDRTQFACGFFACAVVKSMSQVGHQPAQKE